MAKITTPKDLERWVAYLHAQPLPLEVKADPWKEPRRLEANAYLWAYVYGPLVEVAGFSPEEWHEHFCIQYFGGMPHTKIDGSQEIRPKRTTTKNEQGKRDVLKGKEFSDFLVYVESECAKHGVFIQREYGV